MALVPQDDPNVKIPKAAKKAAAKADELHKQAYKPEEKAEEPPPKTEATAPAEPPTAEKAEAAPTPPAEPTPPPTAPEPSKAEEPNWEHRYNSMKGRFDRAQDVVNQQTQTITKLNERMEKLEEALKEKPIERADPPEVFLTKEEEEEYGADFLNVVGKRAKQVISEEVTSLREQVKSLQETLAVVSNTSHRDSQEKMFQTLDEKCPDWHKLNTDPSFLQWLQLPDTYSGAIRHNLLKEAFERNDTPRVLAFFNGFLAEEAAVAPAEPETPLEAAPSPSKVSLHELAAPGRAKTPAATNAPAEKPIITRAQIAAFYADVTSGKYRGKEEEKEKLEKMIFSAQQDGRIR